MHQFLKYLRNDRIVRSVIFLSISVMAIFYWWTLDKSITPENFYYQPLLVKTFVFLNLPVILLSGLLFYPMSSSETLFGSHSIALGLYYGTLIVTYIVQWSLVGILLSKVIQLFRK